MHPVGDRSILGKNSAHIDAEYADLLSEMNYSAFCDIFHLFFLIVTVRINYLIPKLVVNFEKAEKVLVSALQMLMVF